MSLDYKKKGAFLAIGNPLLDVSAVVPKEFLEKYGLKEANAILAGDEHQKICDDMEANYKVEYLAGGAALNSARAAQWILGSDATCRYVGSVGRDARGAKLDEVTRKDGIEPHFFNSDLDTGYCAVLVTGKDRSLVANLQAANAYQGKHLEDNWHLAEEASVIYGTGYFLAVSPESHLKLGKHCSENGKTFMLNLAAPYVMEFFWDQLKSVLPYCDYIFSNEDEAMTLGKLHGFGKDLQEIAMSLGQFEKANDRSRVVVITQGPGEVIVYQNGETSLHATPVVPNDEIVDLNGAGDCFVGGFVAGMLKNADLKTCLDFGHYSAGYCIRNAGIQFNDTPLERYAKYTA